MVDITKILFLILLLKNNKVKILWIVFYEVNTSTKTVVRHGLSQCNFPEEMRGEVAVISQMAVPLKRLIQIGN